MRIDALPTPEEQENALIKAIMRGNSEEVEYLVGVRNYRGIGFPLRQSAFNAAMACGNVEIAKTLSAHGCRYNDISLYNAISSRSLPMLRYAFDDLGIKFEPRFFKHALEIEWNIGEDDDVVRAVLDQANECGFFESSNEVLWDESLPQSIKKFMVRIIGTDIFFYTINILDENLSYEFFYETDPGGEKDYSDLLVKSIEKNDFDSFKAVWDRIYKSAFYSIDKDNFDGCIGARELANKLFALTSDRGYKKFFEYISNFAEPDFRTLFYIKRDNILSA